VTPAVVLAMLAIHRGGMPAAAREWLGTGALTLVGLSIVHLFGLGGDGRIDSGLILVLAFMAIVVRLRFWHMVGSTVTLIAAYIGMTTLRFGPADATTQHNTSVLMAGAIFMLAANYFLEREYRRSYLYGVQNRLHVAALRESNDKLTALSHLDALTGIANRRSFDEQLANLCRQADQEPFGIIILDIDYFKNFNDLYGHPVGDDCIRRVAGILRASMRRTGDRVARFGGEEFVALLPRTGLKESIDVAERMRRGIRDLGIPHGSSRIAPVVTISAGVLWVSSLSDPAGVLARADAALYQAKREGRDRVCVAES
jgi:diguanylate cyclase (GGDEF)-like protein